MRFRFGRLDHQRPGNRERHGRGVEPVVDETLRDVFGGDAGRLGEGPQVEDALVGHETVGPGVQDRVVRREAPGHVVGVQDRDQ